jgi:galactonate dehydratase
MKISSIRTYTFQCGNRRPVIAEVMTDESLSGIGEAGVAYGVGGSAASAMILEIGQRWAVGQNPFNIEQIWNDAYDHSFWSKAGGPIFFSAISAIEQALWDIKGKVLGVPVYELMGGPLRDSIPLYANGWWADCSTADEFARAGIRAVERGFKALKLYPLGMPDPVTVVRHPVRRHVGREVTNLAVQRVRELRKAVGHDIDIMLDFGGGLATYETISIARQLEEFDILYIEEPVDPFVPGALRQVADNTSIAIAAGERSYSRYGFHQLLSTQAVSIIQPDVCNTGGLFEAKKIAAMSEVYNVLVAPHNYGSPLATAVAIQLDATIPNLLSQEFFPAFNTEPNYLEFLDGNVESLATDGFMPLPTDPGLGVQLRREIVEPHLSGETVGG